MIGAEQKPIAILVSCVALISACSEIAKLLSLAGDGRLERNDIAELANSHTAISRTNRIGYISSSEMAVVLLDHSSVCVSQRHVVLTEEGIRFFRQAATGRESSDIMFRKTDGRAWKRAEQQRPLFGDLRRCLCSHFLNRPFVSLATGMLPSSSKNVVIGYASDLVGLFAAALAVVFGIAVDRIGKSRPWSKVCNKLDLNQALHAEDQGQSQSVH